jgi:hypothetical protein
MRNILAVVVGVLLSQVAFATIVAPVTIPELYKESEVVVYGEIEAGKILADDCGVEYAIRVDTSFKGRASPANLIWFQSSGPIQVGANYFLFLSSTDKEFIPLVSTNSDALESKAEYIKTCKDKRPAFVVNVFGNGALKATGTYNDGLPKAVILGDILIPPTELNVTKLGPYDRYDNDRDDIALDSEKFTAYIKALSVAP